MGESQDEGEHGKGFQDGAEPLEESQKEEELGMYITFTYYLANLILLFYGVKPSWMLILQGKFWHFHIYVKNYHSFQGKARQGKIANLQLF